MKLMNVFGKKKKVSKDADASVSEEAQVKPTIARGPGGKFISAKKTKGQPKAQNKKATRKSQAADSPPDKSDKAQSIPQKSPDLTPDLKPQVSVFYSHDIRKFYLDGVWYFSVIDFFPIAKIANPSEYLNKLQQTKEAEKIFSKFARSISYTNSAGEKESLECITYQGFIQLMPILRLDDNFFPGPLPKWLQEMSSKPA